MLFVAGFECKDKRFHLAPWQGWTVWAAQGVWIVACCYSRWRLVQKGAPTRETLRGSAAGRDLEQGASGPDTMLVVLRPEGEAPAGYEMTVENDDALFNRTPLENFSPLQPDEGRQSILPQRPHPTRACSSRSSRPTRIVWEGLEQLAPPRSINMIPTGRTIDEAEADTTRGLMAAHKTRHQRTRDVPKKDLERAVRARSPIRTVCKSVKMMEQEELELAQRANLPTSEPLTLEEDVARCTARKRARALKDKARLAKSFPIELQEIVAPRTASSLPGEAEESSIQERASSLPEEQEGFPFPDMRITPTTRPRPANGCQLVDKPGPDIELMKLQPRRRQCSNSSWNLKDTETTPAAQEDGQLPHPASPQSGLLKHLQKERFGPKAGAAYAPTRPSPLRNHSGPTVRMPTGFIRRTGSVTPPRASKEVEETMMSGALDPEAHLSTPRQIPVVSPEDPPVIKSVNAKGKGKIVVREQSRLERLGLVPLERRPFEWLEFDLMGVEDESEARELSPSRIPTSASQCPEMAPLKRCRKLRGESWDSGIYIDDDEAVRES